MTATLVAHGLAGGYGHRILFEGIDLTVGPGDVLGIVGANGAGKSTLLRLLAGADAPFSGSLTRSPSDAFVGHLPQEHERVAGETVGAYIARRTGCAAATRAMDEAAEALAGPDGGAADAYAAALEHWLASGAADLEDRIPAASARRQTAWARGEIAGRAAKKSTRDSSFERPDCRYRSRRRDLGWRDTDAGPRRRNA